MTRTLPAFLGCLLFAFAIIPCPATAEELPLWELGIGATAFTFPDYIGSKEQSYMALPFPYFVYRGEIVKVNREAISGKIFSTDRLRVTLSFGGSLPVDSKHNDARRGMPDLDLLGEVGPNLRYLVCVTPERRHRLLADVPVRAVFSFDLHEVGHQGFVSTPNLRYTYRRERWVTDASVGVQIEDERYNDYFYGVDPVYATGSRRAYDAHGGFGGMRTSVGLTYRAGRWWLGAFLRYADVNGATFSDSPLVTDHQGFTAGLAFAWIFARSTKTVDVTRDAFE